MYVAEVKNITMVKTTTKDTFDSAENVGQTSKSGIVSRRFCLVFFQDTSRHKGPRNPLVDAIAYPWIQESVIFIYHKMGG